MIKELTSKQLYLKKYHERNKEKILLRKKEYRLKNIDKIKNYQNKYDKNYYLKNKTKIIEYKKIYYKNNKKEILVKSNLRHKARKKVDFMYKLCGNLRCRLKDFLRNKNLNKKYKFSQYIGCNINDLKTHIESQFSDGMSWENYGKWHIDHIIPLSSAANDEQMYKLCHYTNLQPLWAIDNLKKHNKIIKKEI